MHKGMSKGVSTSTDKGINKGSATLTAPRL